MRRLAYIGAILLFAGSLIGFIVTMMLNSFVWADYGAYGKVPIPGTGTVHLPAGQISVSFNTQVIGNTRGGLPIPELGLTIVPPNGVADPPVTEKFGNTTTMNNDSYRQVWVTQIAQPGDYVIKADGKVNGYISPTLAFGHGSSRGYVPWLFAGPFVVALATFIVLSFTGSRKRKIQPPRVNPLDPEVPGVAAYQPAASYVPSDEGAKLSQLKTLSDLHSSGALTDAEFEAEKRLILGS